MCTWSNFNVPVPIRSKCLNWCVFSVVFFRIALWVRKTSFSLRIVTFYLCERVIIGSYRIRMGSYTMLFVVDRSDDGTKLTRCTRWVIYVYRNNSGEISFSNQFNEPNFFKRISLPNCSPNELRSPSTRSVSTLGKSSVHSTTPTWPKVMLHGTWIKSWALWCWTIIAENIRRFSLINVTNSLYVSIRMRLITCGHNGK